MNRKTKLNYIGAETERIGSEGRAPPVRHRLKPQTVHIYESHTEGAAEACAIGTIFILLAKEWFVNDDSIW